jgi:hypothetical protein
MGSYPVQIASGVVSVDDALHPLAGYCFVRSISPIRAAAITAWSLE